MSDDPDGGFWPAHHPLRRIERKIDAVKAEVDAILGRLGRPMRLAFELPTRTTLKGVPMPNYELANDEVLTVTIKAVDAAGATVPLPPGATYTATSSSTSLQAAIGADAAGNPAVVLTPMVQASPNITVTVADSAGLTSIAQIFDIVPDVAPTALTLDTVDATHVAQPVPTAPGP